jgi:hypothetical protein
MENGGDLRNYMTSRYASSMVFLSLLLAAELNVLFDSAPITTKIRQALQEQAHFKLQFWIGLTILISIILTLLSLIITYTAWGMVSAISDENAHCILRSSIGQYVGELPHRFLVASIYSFLLWIIMMTFVLMPVGFWNIALVTVVVILFIHVMTAFSSFGRLILHTTAMSTNRIFEEGYEQSLTPQPLQEQLYTRAKAEISNNTSITRQYRRKMEPLGRMYDQDELAAFMKQAGNRGSFDPPVLSIINRIRTDSKLHGRTRADSTVRFADQLLTTSPVMRDESPSRERLLTPTVEVSSLASQSPNDSMNPSTTRESIRAVKSSSASRFPAPPLRDFAPRGLSMESLEGWLDGTAPSQASKDEPDNGPSILPKEVVAKVRRILSAVSSIETDPDVFPSYDKNLLTDDEKFDLDYGGDFLFETNIAENNNETKRLLDEKPSNYSSTARDDNV